MQFWQFAFSEMCFPRRQQRGMVLLLTLLIAAVLWILSMAAFEIVALDLRVGQRSIEAVRLFHVTDAALRLCETRIAINEADAHGDRAGPLQQTNTEKKSALVRASVSPNASAATRPTAPSSPEPGRWRRTGALMSGAPGVIDILVAWRGQSFIVPCLAERWTAVPASTEAQLWLLTVRSPPAIGTKHSPSQGPGVWLQSAIEVGKTPQRRWWRSIAEPPP
jgi:hypothetical protein